MRVSTYWVTSWLPLQVTRMPGYFGFARAVDSTAGGASDLGATCFDAGADSPAAEVLIMGNVGARGSAGCTGEPGDLSDSESCESVGRILPKTQRKSVS